MDTYPHPFDRLEPEPSPRTRLRPKPELIQLLVKQAGGYSAVARAVGSSPGMIHDVAHGRRGGSEEFLTRLATKGFGLAVDDITVRVPVGREVAA